VFSIHFLEYRSRNQLKLAVTAAIFREAVVCQRGVQNRRWPVSQKGTSFRWLGVKEFTCALGRDVLLSMTFALALGVVIAIMNQEGTERTLGYETKRTPAAALGRLSWQYLGKLKPPFTLNIFVRNTRIPIQKATISCLETGSQW